LCDFTLVLTSICPKPKSQKQVGRQTKGAYGGKKGQVAVAKMKGDESKGGRSEHGSKFPNFSQTACAPTTTTMLLLLFSFSAAETSAQRVYHADHSLSLSFHIIAHTHGIVKVTAQLEKVIKRRKQIVSPWQKGTEYT
jgi:hypothetical protein